MSRTLDFSLLDDALPLLLQGHSQPASDAISSASVIAIGPLLELAFQADGVTTIPPLSQLSSSASVAALRVMRENSGARAFPLSSSHDACPVEYHRAPADKSGFSSPHWVMFVRRFQNAAEQAGFTRRVASGMAGAFIEMADNVLHHSKAPESGWVGYRWEADGFEYAVADAGIGVLASLHSCPDYAELCDDGDALETALQSGESCFGRNSGHGMGFRSVFVSLANLNGRLRFRSGEYALTIDGTSPDLSHARLSQIGIRFAGFLVSVFCRP